MKMQVVTAWELKSSDLIVLRGRHYIILSKNLVPFGGGEIGFCINFKEQGCRMTPSISSSRSRNELLPR